MASEADRDVNRDVDGDVVEGWAGWADDFRRMLRRIGPCFGRRDLRGRAGGCVRGLLGRVDRKNGWQLAEHLGDDGPFPCMSRDNPCTVGALFRYVVSIGTECN